VLREDDYELMPHTELEYLRKEVERLKRNPLGDTQASITLLDSMNKLNISIAKLNDILAGANDDMVKAYSENSVQDQLRKMAEQNEKLARGIVAVAELVKELQKKQPLPEIDQLIAKPAQQSSTPQPMTVEVQQRNPFAEEQRDFAAFGQPKPQQLNASEYAPPRQESNAPGFMMHPGLKERIPDTDIPPPPRRF
jgi:hypothetical protein